MNGISEFLGEYYDAMEQADACNMGESKVKVNGFGKLNSYLKFI